MKNFKLKVEGEYVRGVIENPKSSKVIILVHGFTGDWNGPENIFLKLSEKLQKEGFSVCRFNFRGTGHSDGKFIDMTVKQETTDLENIIKFLSTENYKSISLLGESMGGTVIGLLNNIKIIDTIIFWYTAFDLFNTDIKDLLLSEKGKEEYKLKGFVECDGYKVGGKFKKEFVNINIYDNLKNIVSPVLLLHGNKDKEVLYTQSEKAYEIILSRKKEIQIIEGADHCFENEQEEVIEKTVSFLISI